MSLISQKIKLFSPAYFSMVMATGIISIAAFLNDMPILAKVLFYGNLLLSLILTLLFLYRTVFHFKLIKEDFKSYKKGPGFFTIIAALCIIGNQFVLLPNGIFIAEIILIVTSVLWLIIFYGFIFYITVTKNKKRIEDGISGSWLLIIVSTQALSALFSLVSNDFNNNTYLFLFLALCLFLLGCIFYLYFMSLIIYRFTFFSLNPTELGAPYWINMGATAISTLAGSLLIMHTTQFHFIVDILSFLKGFTLFFWAAGTWWIPFLVLLGVWRHLIHKRPVPTSGKGYNVTYWAMVFPLGMYTVCTYRLSEALEIGFLKDISAVFIYIAIFTWIAVLLGFIRHWSGLFARNTEKSQ